MTTISPGADHRIRGYTRGVALVSAVVALATLAAVMLPAVERQRSLATERPWVGDERPVATRDGSAFVWTADGSARIVLPDALRGRAIELSLVDEDADDVEAWLGDETSTEPPRYLGGLWGTSPLPLAAYARSELWIVSPHAWRLQIVPIDPTPLEGVASGTTDAVLVYTGGAVSGTVTWGATGTLFVIARTIDGYESLAVTGGDPALEQGGSTEFTWTASPFVVIEVSAYDGIEWTIELDEPGPDAGVTPAPSSGTTPTPTSDSEAATP
jgi:hypothetical protein